MAFFELPNYFLMTYTESDGRLTPGAQLYNDQLYRFLLELQHMLNDGWTIPTKTNIQITAYGADTNVPNGTIWFSSDDSKLKVKTAAATIEEIQSM